ncbi:MAG: hypothetical protein KF749_03185 [Bacteroidetes bacterium]|nr:hypothetical protein [Bacteroidota bacterium]MCW5895494.1 hypothetical protein [Bacteroidota bacterium]
MPTQKEDFIGVWEHEFQTTVKVLKAYPSDKLDLKPAAKSKSARELLSVFINEQHFFSQILDGALDFTSQAPQPLPTLAEIVSATEKGNAAIVAKLKSMPDSSFEDSVTFPVAPKTMAPVRKMDLCWMMLLDSVHHRGQLSVYIRLADGKVPSIYGPTADEPWM